jgi:hypothetical protein
MAYKYFLILLVATVLCSCSKDGEGKNICVVSAPKIIGLTGNNWDDVSPQLRFKTGYEYTKAPNNMATIIKGEAHLPAVDDSNRVVKGRFLLNIAPDNTVSYASFDTEPVDKTIAYAMMLNYNNESLQLLTNISFSIGEVVENGIGGNTSVGIVLSKLTSAQEASQLGITYWSAQGNFTAVIFRQNDGRYIFSYRGWP